METTEIINSLKNALAELRIAEMELNRPHEDVVSMSVCFGARNSLNSLLKTYLMSNNIDSATSNNTKELLNQCLEFDNRFSTLDISSMMCNELNHEGCDGKYCLSVSKVDECVTLANQVKSIVLEKLKINESEFN